MATTRSSPWSCTERHRWLSQGSCPLPRACASAGREVVRALTRAHVTGDMQALFGVWPTRTILSALYVFPSLAYLAYLLLASPRLALLFQRIAPLRYGARVSAESKAGLSLTSTETGFVTKGEVPTAPSCTFQVGMTQSSITLMWIPPEYENGSDVEVRGRGAHKDEGRRGGEGGSRWCGRVTRARFHVIRRISGGRMLLMQLLFVPLSVLHSQGVRAAALCGVSSAQRCGYAPHGQARQVLPRAGPQRALPHPRRRELPPGDVVVQSKCAGQHAACRGDDQAMGNACNDSRGSGADNAANINS